MVYMADPPATSSFEPVVEAIAREIAQGRMRAFGVRNWTPASIRAAHAYATEAKLRCPSQIEKEK
jgi:aryl-alcohol dehydrogenase-like predicted oxidoreductase